jgi:hypothetical protein
MSFRRPAQWDGIFAAICASLLFLALVIGPLLILTATQATAPATPPQTAPDSLHPALLDWWQKQDIKIQIITLSPFITFLTNMVWFWASLLWKELLHRWSARSTVYPFTLTRAATKDRYDKIKHLITGFSCLVVRYGTDQYVSTLASDQEKYEGRLKNEVRPINIHIGQVGDATFILRLPIHKRIGTQFKCFATVKDESSLSTVQAFLNECEGVKDAQVSKSVKSNRIYFLVERFAVVKTIDGIDNNMILPE